MYDKVLSIDPIASPILASKSMVLDNMGRYDEALETLDFLLSINPNDPFTNLGKGKIMYYNGQYNEAVTLFDKCLFFYP